MSKTVSITLTDTARAIIALETRAGRIIYRNYITEHDMTRDDVKAHVKALADAAADAGTFETLATESGRTVAKERDAFMTRVRNGLNYWLPVEKAADAADDDEGADEGADEGTDEGTDESADAAAIDWHAVLRQATLNAINNGLTPDEVMAAVSDVLKMAAREAAAA